MHPKRNENITLTLNSNMTKITLLSALTALLILPSIVSAATTADFNPGPGETASAGTWTRVLTVTTSAAGNAESKGAQTVDINVTSGAFVSMQYRTVKQNKNQTSYQYGDATQLVFGQNTIIVGAVTNAEFLADTTLGRSVKVQFRTDGIGFDTLTINDVNANPDEVDGSPFLGQSLSASDNFVAGPNTTWQAVLPLTTVADGVASQGVQTAVIDVTYIPPGGANYRVYKTNELGGDYWSPPTALVLGENSVSVTAVAFDRAVNLQFSNDAVEFDALEVNGEDMLAGPLSPAEGTQGTGEPISQYSDVFAAGSNADYPEVATLALTGEGAATLGEQTLVMNITYIPVGGASYRVYKTLGTAQENGNPANDTSNGQALTLGANTITVPAVTFDGDIQSRTVKAQFSGDDIEFDALSINGENQLTTTPAEGTQDVGDSISDFSNIISTNFDGSWFVAAMTTPDDGAASQAEQTAVINVTYIPEGGATWRSNSTVASGVYNAANEGPLALGPNTITVAAVAFDRTVNIQFSSDAIEFDALTFNGENPLVTTPGTGTQGIGQSISESTDIFVATGNSAQAQGWMSVTTMTTTGGEAPSQGAQTLEMNVTYIPGSGAQMRSYNTNETSGGTFLGAQTLTLGVNTITVPATVGWANPDQGRATKIQFSSVDVEFDALTFNGVDQLSTPAEGTPGTGDPISDSSNVIPANHDGSWYVATMTTPDDGAASQGEQTAVINVTYIPEGGATWRSNSTNDLGNYISGADQTLVIGPNTITVSAVDFDRTVKIQISSDAIEFDALTFNGVNPLAVGDSGDTVTIANSNLFNAGPDATWVAVLTTSVSQDGASSRSQQAVVLNVTSLPVGGANYRVVETVADGTWYVGDSQPLGTGANTITVNSVAFDRTVKVQFSSDAVEYNALSIGGVARTIGADVSEVPSVSISGTTLSWTETDGTTLQFSDNLESWTSLPSATSPYSPSTTPDRFYRTISEEEE